MKILDKPDVVEIILSNLMKLHKISHIVNGIDGPTVTTIAVTIPQILYNKSHRG